MMSIAARPRPGLLRLVRAMAPKKAAHVERAVLGGPPAPRPAREIALRCRRHEDDRLTGIRRI
ncbi:hypothetical protein ACQP2F_12075 [Actinoplanes sp. CA-030573]|uniref:hypothetical protein n=1 Tax=Actinoplanes sp. CA-030573 TaxID=3239898 RepID=UPI003D8CE9FC